MTSDAREQSASATEHEDANGSTFRVIHSDDDDGGKWTIEGTAHVCGLDGLPDKILDMHETEQYAVFSNDETLLLKPVDEVNP